MSEWNLALCAVKSQKASAVYINGNILTYTKNQPVLIPSCFLSQVPQSPSKDQLMEVNMLSWSSSPSWVRIGFNFWTLLRLWVQLVCPPGCFRYDWHVLSNEFVDMDVQTPCQRIKTEFCCQGNETRLSFSFTSIFAPKSCLPLLDSSTLNFFFNSRFPFLF